MADTFKTASDLRWKIALLVSAAIAISYLDRQTLVETLIR
jgi:hypothetical protein